MRAAVPPGRKLEWRLNGQLLAQDTTTLDWAVQRGRFRVDVRTLDSGEPLSAAAEFIVK